MSGGGAQQVTALAAPAPASLPYTVYFGNLHSQTNHSDGGGALASCIGAQNPQSGTLGPTDAYTYAMNKGLDFLMASEHNHMYDGSDATNASADPVAAKALYQSGLSAAANFNAAHPNFLGVYGLEWGVINNGGHMNIFNTPELLGWEYNGSGQLIGDTLTAKGDYAGLYTLMRQRGWVGQFNHPATTGQFLVGGVPFGYTADGDQAMAMCEVLNTSAFSTNTTETETSRSTYEGACKKALEAGYHIAFTTNQDNHCANWGASYTNRTGVLIPNGTALNQASFIDALKARRVFATMDKGSQLVLTANGHIMGERFTNSGALNLVANFASSAGKAVSTILMYEGVPGRNGTVTQLSTTANTTITPAIGEHFYYAKLTQTDGNILWSAPIWVTQSNSSDTVAPTVSASETGSSGTITLSASASDNVGVTNVEFYVDSVLKASSNVAPYSAALNSTTLSNGSHALVAKAYDAAGNVGTSSVLRLQRQQRRRRHHRADRQRQRDRHQRHHHLVGYRQRQRGRHQGRVLRRRRTQRQRRHVAVFDHAQFDHAGQRQPRVDGESVRCGRQQRHVGRGQLQRQQRRHPADRQWRLRVGCHLVDRGERRDHLGCDRGRACRHLESLAGRLRRGAYRHRVPAVHDSIDGHQRDPGILAAGRFERDHHHHGL